MIDCLLFYVFWEQWHHVAILASFFCVSLLEMKTSEKTEMQVITLLPTKSVSYQKQTGTIHKS